MINSIKINCLIFIFLMIAHFSAICQERCASSQYNSKLKDDFKSRERNFEEKVQQFLRKNSLSRQQSDTSIITIPVVVHIIHNNSSGTIGGKNNTNISDEMVHSQIKILNEDFRKKTGTMGYSSSPIAADVQFEFCLATADPKCNPTTGITRTYYNKVEYDYTTDDQLLKSLSYWPSDQYLNIWVCNLNGNTLGYTQFPSYTELSDLDNYNGPTTTDGVVISYIAFGLNPESAKGKKFIYGRTATHEIGHWFGLRHVWGDEFCGDDYCADTYPQENSSSDSITCPVHISNCNNGSYLYNNTNYLDYSADACMKQFTYDQKARMRAVLYASENRKKLLTSNGCKTVAKQVAPFLFQNSNFDQMKLNGWDSIVVNSGQIQVSSQVSLFSPQINLTSMDNPYLKIIANASTNDTLFVNSYTNCGKTISNLFKLNFKDSKQDTIFYLGLNTIRKNTQIQFEFKNSNASLIQISEIELKNIQKSPWFADNRLFMNRETVLSSDQVNVQIFDISSRKIASISIPNNDSTMYEHDLSFLSQGLYISKIEVNGNTEIKKFIIY